MALLTPFYNSIRLFYITITYNVSAIIVLLLIRWTNVSHFIDSLKFLTIRHIGLLIESEVLMK